MLKEGDIVQIKSLNKEGMILNFAYDLNTHEDKIVIVIENNYIILCKTDDIIKIDTLENMLQNFNNMMTEDKSKFTA